MELLRSKAAGACVINPKSDVKAQVASGFHYHSQATTMRSAGCGIEVLVHNHGS